MRVRVGRCVVASAPGCLPAVSLWALHAVVLLIDLSCGAFYQGALWHLCCFALVGILLCGLCGRWHRHRMWNAACAMAVVSLSTVPWCTLVISFEQCLWACLCMPVISWFLCSPCFCVLFCFSVWSPYHVAWISVWLRVWKVCVGVRLCWLHFVYMSIQCEYVPCIHSDVGL